MYTKDTKNINHKKNINKIKNFNDLLNKSLNNKERKISSGATNLEKSKLSTKIFSYNKDKTFKDSVSSNISLGKKSIDFCKKHHVNIILCGGILTLGGMFINISTAKSNLDQNINTNSYVYSNFGDKQDDIKLEKDITDYNFYTEAINNSDFSEFDQINPDSKNFTYSKDLYLGYMQNLLKGKENINNLKMNDSEVLTFLKAEYLYNSGVKKNLENKKVNLSNEDLLVSNNKLLGIDDNLKKLKDNYEQLIEGKEIGLKYIKHGFDINIKYENNNYIVSGLENFEF